MADPVLSLVAWLGELRLVPEGKRTGNGLQSSQLKCVDQLYSDMPLWHYGLVEGKGRRETLEDAVNDDR